MTIVIDKYEDHFFISINKIGGHSFVMLGMYDQTNFKHLLCRVGKVAYNQEGNIKSFELIKYWCKALFFTRKACLIDEKIMKHRKQVQQISYQAYDISYHQYLEFIQLLETLQTEERKFYCYKPELFNDKIVLNPTNKPIFPEQPPGSIQKKLGELSINNTCRHSAIGLIESVLHAPVSSLVSSNFLSNLPYETVLEDGKPSKHIPFYVFPTSPASFHDLDETKKKIITKLYKRMEYMLFIKTYAPQTQVKFLKLKDLYLQLIGPQRDLSLYELLENIQTWKQQHKPILGSLRKTYFWDHFLKRQSATMNLMTEVEQDLKRVL